MNKITEEIILEKGVAETTNVAVSFVGWLDVGEVITGNPTVVEVTTSDLTLDNKTRNTTEITVNGKKVAESKAVQFSVAGGVVNTRYSILITFTTSGGQTRTYYLKLDVVTLQS